MAALLAYEVLRELQQRDHSMLTFESAAVQGVSGIIEKLKVRHFGSSAPFQADVRAKSLPFQKVQHKLSTLDAQPSNESGGILVTVTGALLVRILLLR